jgi:hypothetical protein
MRLLLLAIAIVPWVHAEVPDAPEHVRARLECEPASAAIGEPVEWTLTVEHPASIAVKLPEKDPLPDDSWVSLGDRRVMHEAAAGGEERTRVRWRVMSLAAGSRALPEIEVDYDEDGSAHTVRTAPQVLDVRGELAADEDAPRPMKGFRPPPPGAEGALHWPWIAALMIGVFAIAIWIFRRSRRKPAPILAATPLDRLAELEREIAADAENLRRVAFGVSTLLRGAIDDFLREPRPGLTDIDWIARIENDERVPLGVRKSTARLLGDFEPVKYALRVPTRFAVDEILRDARGALEALSLAPRPESPPEAARSSEPGAGKEAA